MTDILDTLKTYPDDPTVVMSRRVVNETISEIERLRAELAALRENSLAVLTRVRAYRDKVITERDALRALLQRARPYLWKHPQLEADIVAALKGDDRE